MKMNKEDRRKVAVNHFNYTQKHFKNETKLSVANTSVYDNLKFITQENEHELPNIKVVACTTEEAIRLVGSPCTVLNFASYTRPGGGFINGAIAQEEALCHSSNLYDVLKEYTYLYDNNYKCGNNNGLYKNWALYSPDICFIYNEKYERYEEIVTANVITCPAPNKTAYCSKNTNKNAYLTVDEAMLQRCKYVLDIAEMHGTSTLILGAYGCGVFGNDPTTVALIFQSLLTSCAYTFETVIFAIPNKKNDNYAAFAKVFDKEANDNVLNFRS